MPTADVRHLTITVSVPFDRAYAIAHHPAYFGRWAAGMARTLHETDAGWVADTPAGEAHVAFTPANPYGVLDHRVKLPGKPEIYMPLRMVANGDGTEVTLTLFRQPDMDDAAVDHDAGLITADLATLRRVLEADFGKQY